MIEQFEFNDRQVCVNPHIVEIKLNWKFCCEIRTAMYDGLWGAAVWYSNGDFGYGEPLASDSDKWFSSEREALVNGIRKAIFLIRRDIERGRRREMSVFSEDFYPQADKLLKMLYERISTSRQMELF